MNSNLYILIMAGGEGTRFHPISTPEKPKQFMKFWGERTFIQQTYDRISDLVLGSNIFVATNDRYVDLVKEQLPEILSENIIGETEKKNTAPCIAYVSKKIYEMDKDAVIIVLPSDHLILKQSEFLNVLKRAVFISTTRDVLVTLGIEPTWAADCYGYIKLGHLIEDDPGGKWHAYTVDKFVEKPSVAVAKGYIDDGKYSWNSGMFIWKARLILDEVQKYLPQIEKLLNKHLAPGAMDQFFKEAESISIDYGVMERSERVVSIPCNIEWSDIGTWESLYNLSKNGTVALDDDISRVMYEQLGVDVQNGHASHSTER